MLSSKMNIEEILKKFKNSSMPKKSKRIFLWFLFKNHFQLLGKSILFFILFFVGLFTAIGFYFSKNIIGVNYFQFTNTVIFLISFTLLYIGLISIVCYYFCFKFSPKIIEYEKKYLKRNI